MKLQVENPQTTYFFHEFYLETFSSAKNADISTVLLVGFADVLATDATISTMGPLIQSSVWQMLKATARGILSSLIPIRRIRNSLSNTVNSFSMFENCLRPIFYISMLIIFFHTSIFLLITFKDSTTLTLNFI